MSVPGLFGAVWLSRSGESEKLAMRYRKFNLHALLDTSVKASRNTEIRCMFFFIAKYLAKPSRQEWNYLNVWKGNLIRHFSWPWVRVWRSSLDCPTQTRDRHFTLLHILRDRSSIKILTLWGPLLTTWVFEIGDPSKRPTAIVCDRPFSQSTFLGTWKSSNRFRPRPIYVSNLKYSSAS